MKPDQDTDDNDIEKRNQDKHMVSIWVLIYVMYTVLTRGSIVTQTHEAVYKKDHDQKEFDMEIYFSRHL